jgi:hypothetical protein
MRSKEIIVLSIVILLLGAFIYFYERHTIGTEEKARRADRILPEFDRDKVSRLEVTSSKGAFAVERAEAKKEKKEPEAEMDLPAQHRWNMVSPFKTAADPGVVDGLLSDVEFLSEERRVEGENAKKTAKFGLDAPGLTITLTMAGKPLKIFIGKEAPGEGMYLRVEGRTDVVYVVSKYAVESFMKEPSEVRDKQLVDLLPAQLESIDVYRGEALVAGFKKSEGRWMGSAAALGGVPVRVSRREVEKLGSLLGSLRAATFISDKASDGELEKQGMKDNPLRVVMKEKEGRGGEIIFGKACGGETKGTGGLAAYVKGTGTLACVGSDVRAALERPLEDYALTTAVEFDEYDLVAFEGFEGEKRTLRMESTDQEDWTITRPQKETAESDTVLALVDFLRTTKFAADAPGTGNPPAGAAKSRLVFYGMDESVLETLHLAVAGEAVFVRREGENLWHELQAAGILANAHKPFHYFRKSVVGEDTYDAMSYSVQAKTGGFYHKLVKDDEGGRWTFEKPLGLEPDPADSRDTIETFASLTAQRFLASRSDQAMARFGLTSPAWVIRAVFAGKTEGEDAGGEETGKEKKRSYTLLLGQKVEGGYAALLEGGGQPVIFVVSEPVFSRLTRPLASRDVFQIDSDRIGAVTLSRGGSSETFLPREGGFEHQSGTEGLFDAAAVAKFVEKLAFLRAEDVAAYGAAAAGSGLQSPRFKASFTLKAQEAASQEESGKTLVFGSRLKGSDEEPQVYAAVEGIPCTYTVGADVLEAAGIEP